MSLIRNPATALAAGVLGLAALLGGSLGLATAATQLNSGFNLIGGPMSDVEPDHFIECIPEDSWKAVYIWESDEQEWRHYFNTDFGDGVPGFVNSVNAGGIEVVPGGGGVILYMDREVADANFPRHASDTC